MPLLINTRKHLRLEPEFLRNVYNIDANATFGGWAHIYICDISILVMMQFSFHGLVPQSNRPLGITFTP